jgi:G2/mitotic-specific cyclin 1/2
MPNPLYMDSQKELAWTMRGILTDWLVQVRVRFHLMPETLFLAVNIIDRFFSARVVSLAKLQLVASSHQGRGGRLSVCLSHFLYCADGLYTENEILQAERYVLKTLDWNMSYLNPLHFLRRVSKADEYDVKAMTIAKYLLEIGCLEWQLLSAPPSLMAAVAIWLARLILHNETWVSLCKRV